MSISSSDGAASSPAELSAVFVRRSMHVLGSLSTRPGPGRTILWSARTRGNRRIGYELNKHHGGQSSLVKEKEKTSRSRDPAHGNRAYLARREGKSVAAVIPDMHRPCGRKGFQARMREEIQAYTQGRLPARRDSGRRGNPHRKKTTALSQEDWRKTSHRASPAA